MAPPSSSADQQVWDITIRDDWTFQDGTPVTASSFVDAWNWAACSPNAALNSSFFEPIEGLRDVQASSTTRATCPASQGGGDERASRSSATPSSR